MNVRADHAICIVNNLAGVVSENDLSFCTFFFDQAFIIVYIVYICECVAGISKQSFELRLRKNVLIWIDSFFVKQVEVKNVVTDFIAWIAEHQHNLFTSFGDATQADCESVSAEDRETTPTVSPPSLLRTSVAS